MIPLKYEHLSEGKRRRVAIIAASRFVADLWSYPPDAFTFIGTRRGDRWRDHAIQGDDRGEQVVEILAAHSPDRFDIYFCPNAFAEPHRHTEFALPSRYAHCDIDKTDPAGYDPQPNILWETSPDRFQGIWIWNKNADGMIAEQYSKAIVYKQGGDKGGWSITKMLRIPGTINHKAAYAQPVVTLRAFDARPQKLPSSLASIERPDKEKQSSRSMSSSGEEAAAIMRRYRLRMGLPAGALMTARRVLRGDRSGAVFQIVAGLIRLGAPDPDIVTVLLANPYFVDKWGEDRERAELEVAKIRSRVEDGQ
ncbi:DNA-primase RepB domain-containing protein [Novosphingobium mathurense]|uniref:RepB DNA-primase n=1 Tax=Novosphingobium mathurense TaxID=428990 RepID=A0A1U6IHM1_9SPHN|nr:DNA-primase RepB domain-containing protein [Novosphingobium mathurense]SLK07505.1 RepB DNA-primase [Novosphingobium mathurense]